MLSHQKAATANDAVCRVFGSMMLRRVGCVAQSDTVKDVISLPWHRKMPGVLPPGMARKGSTETKPRPTGYRRTKPGIGKPNSRREQYTTHYTHACSCESWLRQRPSDQAWRRITSASCADGGFSLPGVPHVPERFGERGAPPILTVHQKLAEALANVSCMIAKT